MSLGRPMNFNLMNARWSKRIRGLLGALTIMATASLTGGTARAASLQQVSNWGVAGLPSDVSMYVYVPDNVAADPPILTLIHYCGGTAGAVFGQAQGGGIVSAADKYGFILVVPSSGRCWDVESDKAWTRNGGGDSHAIKQMVTYALGKYSANANRVYSTGDSSGGMMTELLLALYPDIFKAGSAFAGMPAGCRGSNEPGTAMGYSGACAGGNVSHTGQQWGDIVDKMDPGYTGHRPRVQLFHGDADGTISYKNFGESIKEWTDVLGLPASPTSTSSGITLGNHQATRQQWNNSCGYLVLDAFTSLGGDHGPSDALFKAQYVIPFLGLDKTGPVDPEIAQCGNGSGGAGGSGGSGGSAAGVGGIGGTGSSVAGSGGLAGSNGSAGASSGGVGNSGGGGASNTAGAATVGEAGRSGSGGATGVGGTSASAGHAGNVTNGGSNSAAGGGSEAPATDSGCSCSLARTQQQTHGNAIGWIAALSLLGLKRRRRKERRI